MCNPVPMKTWFFLRSSYVNRHTDLQVRMLSGRKIHTNTILFAQLSHCESRNHLRLEPRYVKRCGYQLQHSRRRIRAGAYLVTITLHNMDNHVSFFLFYFLFILFFFFLLL